MDDVQDVRDGEPDGLSATRPWWRRRLLLVPVGVLLLLGAVYGIDLLASGSDVPRGTTVAGVALGGLDRESAATRLTEQVVPEVLRPREATAGDVDLTVDPAATGISIDLDATLDSVAGQPLNPVTRLRSLFGGGREVAPVLAVDDAGRAAGLDALGEAAATEPVEGGITIEGVTATAVAPVEGQRLDADAAAEAIDAAIAADEDRIELPVTVQPAEVDAAAVQAALTDVAEPALSAPVTLTGADGFSAELPVEAVAAALRFTPTDDGRLDGSVDAAALATALGDTLADLATAPQDASFGLTGGEIRITPAVPGATPDVPALAEALPAVLTAAAPRELAVPVVEQAADLTTAEAQALGITEQVSTFTTVFTNDASGENIRVVAAEVDGAVVLPGETFSLNGFTGPRTEAEGYVESTIISGGEFVQAVGGGISQFATTMFNAVFFAGLEDVTHQPHSYYISRYPAGREATVFYDSIDLAWRNDSPTGIYVQTEWSPGGSITVTFWGTPRYDIESISGERYNYSDYETIEKEQDGDCAEQAGSEGFDIAVTRVFRPLGGGGVLREEVFSTRYNAVPEIRCVPAG